VITNEVQLGEVLEFWFGELTMKEWFGGGAELDGRIRERFAEVHRAVAAGEYWKYRTSPESFLAEVIVLDQFSRNMFRGEARAYAYDGQALAIAQQAIMAGYDQELPPEQRAFLYLPFMHSESALMHVEAMRLFEALGSEEHLKYEKIHKDIIDRFGRYPHRNDVLGRESTEAEKEYLANNHEAFF
jgi:uncharacterized protein (DUF924 family)